MDYEPTTEGEGENEDVRRFISQLIEEVEDDDDDEFHGSNR
jgi:hypothetical protein